MQKNLHQLEIALADAEAVLRSAVADAEAARLAYFEATEGKAKSAAKIRVDTAEAFRADAELERDAALHKLNAARQAAKEAERQANEARFAELGRLLRPEAIREAAQHLADEEVDILAKLARVRQARRDMRNRYRSLEVEHEALGPKVGVAVEHQSTWARADNGRIVTLPTMADLAVAVAPIIDGLRAHIDRCAPEDPVRAFLFDVAPRSLATYQPNRDFFPKEIGK